MPDVPDPDDIPQEAMGSGFLRDAPLSEPEPDELNALAELDPSAAGIGNEDVRHERGL
jgi:hypothetical protein